MRADVAGLAEGLEIAPGPLLAAAAGQTGFDDFGDDRFREALAVLCGALMEEAGLSPVGVVIAHTQLVALLKNRLLIEDLLRRHPEIDDLTVNRPIVIAGLPRTGTTHLHNLLSADPGLRSLPYWESLEPVLAAGERVGPDGADPRRERTGAALAFMGSAIPLFERMHEMTIDHAHEEIQLLGIDLSSMLFETMAVMPSWRDWYRGTDQTPSYGYLKRVLKVLQWLRGGTRWVLKSPQHLEQFGPLMATFPDATVVVTHRDPVSITASLATMVTYTARLSLARVDPGQIGRYWADRVGDLLAACTAERDTLPTDRSLDVAFDDLLGDDLAVVERIYDVAGQPMTAAGRAAMTTFMAEHPRGRHGRVIYDLADFGLDPGERRRALRAYIERFDVAEEAHDR
ncbi:MAG: sulfotransferase [Acidimicrobiia bacterium]|nr:sulfotransferase [Acidimicrobiia bacterium]